MNLFLPQIKIATNKFMFQCFKKRQEQTQFALKPTIVYALFKYI